MAKVEKKITTKRKDNMVRDMEQEGFRHSRVDHLVTKIILAKECIKTNGLIFCFLKEFDTILADQHRENIKNKRV
jgi:hypothetical protein